MSAKVPYIYFRKKALYLWQMRAESVVSSGRDMSTKELRVLQNSPVFLQRVIFRKIMARSVISPIKPICLQKSPIFLQKSPVFLQRSISPQYKGKQCCVQKGPHILLYIPSGERQRQGVKERERERGTDRVYSIRQCVCIPKEPNVFMHNAQYFHILMAGSVVSREPM